MENLLGCTVDFMGRSDMSFGGRVRVMGVYEFVVLTITLCHYQVSKLTLGFIGPKAGRG